MAKMTVRLNEEDQSKLNEIIEQQYKGRTDRTNAIRWLIQDTWETMKKMEKIKAEEPLC